MSEKEKQEYDKMKEQMVRLSNSQQSSQTSRALC